MKHHTAIFLLAIGAALSTTARASSEPDTLVYLESQAMPKRASVCASRLAGFGPKFDQKFAAWSAANQARITAGEAALRAEARNTRQDFTSQVQSVTLIAAQNLERATPELLKEDCNAMLDELKLTARSGH